MDGIINLTKQDSPNSSSLKKAELKKKLYKVALTQFASKMAY